jgi:hypothetical protein
MNEKRRKERWMDAYKYINKWKQNKTGRDKTTVIIKSKV